MDFAVAYMLLMKANLKPNVDNFQMLYKVIGALCDEDALQAFLSKIEDVVYDEVLEKGDAKIKSLAIQTASKAAAEAPVAETPKEEVKEVEEEAVEVSLFGGDDDFF